MDLGNGTTLTIDAQTARLESKVWRGDRLTGGGCAAAAALVLFAFGAHLEAWSVFLLSGIIGYGAYRAARAEVRTEFDDLRGQISVTSSSPLGRVTAKYRYDEVAAIGIDEHGFGYAAELHLRDGRRTRLMWSHNDYAVLELRLEPLWTLTGIAKADPAARLRAAQRVQGNIGHAPASAASGSSGNSMEVKDAVEAQVSFETPATPRFVVEGQVATLSSPAADATPGFVVLGGLGLVGVVLLVRGIGYTRLGEFFFGLIWSAFIGLMLIVWCKWVPGASKVEFDAQAKHVRIEKRNGRHRTTERIAFADVESIGVTEYMDDASRCFRPVLRTRDARELDLSRENENFLYWHRVMIRVIEITGLTRRDTLIGL